MVKWLKYGIFYVALFYGIIFSKINPAALSNNFSLNSFEEIVQKITGKFFFLQKLYMEEFSYK
jgi:hypothetical protein